MMKIYSRNKTPENKIKIFNEGGTRCFEANQLIITNKGSKKISDLKINDVILTYNHDKNHDEFKKVVNCCHQNNIKKAYLIKFKDGSEIKCTFDHEFYHNGGYIIIEKLLLSLPEKRL